MSLQQSILFAGSAVATLAVHAAVASVLGLSTAHVPKPLPQGDSLSNVIRVSFSQPGGITGNADPVVAEPQARVAPVPPTPRAKPPAPVARREAPKPPAPQPVPAPVAAIAPAPAPVVQPSEPVAELQQPAAAATVSHSTAPVVVASAGKAGLNDAVDGGATRSGIATGKDIPAEFTRALLTRLAKNKHYPFKARLAKIEGVGKVYFEVDAKGRLTAFRLTESTRSAELDSAIQHLFNKSFPLPPVIARMGPQQGAAFSLPIAYYLNH